MDKAPQHTTLRLDSRDAPLETRRVPRPQQPVPLPEPRPLLASAASRPSSHCAPGGTTSSGDEAREDRSFSEESRLCGPEPRAAGPRSCCPDSAASALVLAPAGVVLPHGNRAPFCPFVLRSAEFLPPSTRGRGIHVRAEKKQVILKLKWEWYVIYYFMGF